MLSTCDHLRRRVLDQLPQGFVSSRLKASHLFSQEINIMPLASKIVAGLIAGGIGAAIGNPADVAMVCRQADDRLTPSQHHNYTSVIDDVTRMTKQEGISSLWRGLSLTVNRAMLVTASQVVFLRSNQIIHFDKWVDERWVRDTRGGEFLYRIFCCGVVKPIDVIKTRVMNMKVSGQKPPYTIALDCAMNTVEEEGPRHYIRRFD
ncbi:IMPACT family member in pol 5'region-like [Hibiscus syriacus]|uniref:IMPACT family member in pol 5'region-like n=1 Tax=Hibiscus syriacus TaxID=106335 RepID=A0A6A3B260_HIBSY|nr:IMPACT family member in pol 5'region-like [Hibiscus syriacus]